MDTSGASTCKQCPENSVSPVGSILSTSCRCKGGYNGSDGGPCAACAVSTYKSDIGSTNCTACPANSVSDIGSAMCTACPANFFSTVGSSLCREYCPEGYWEMPLIDLCVNRRCTAEASSHWTYWEADRMFDNDVNTFWRANDFKQYQWWRIDFGRPTAVESVEEHTYSVGQSFSVEPPGDIYVLKEPYSYYSGSDALLTNNAQ
jgi:hypothetical protein